MSDATMLTIQNISAGYGPISVLRNINLEIQAGEFVGLIGPNGSGKSTLLKVISGLLQPTAGQIELEGEIVSRLPRKKLARKLACLPQSITLDAPFTVMEVALMGRTPHIGAFGWESQEDIDLAKTALAMADVEPLADRLITQLSGGERQRAYIAMCLAQEPQLLLLDEPTSHLDIGHQLTILNLFAKLNRQKGTTILAVFHDLNLAAEYCSRLMLMDQGQIIADGQPKDVVTPDLLLRTYGADLSVNANPISGRPVVHFAANR